MIRKLNFVLLFMLMFCLFLSVNQAGAASVSFCLEGSCDSVTVTFGGQTHSSTLNCANILVFENVPAGTYQFSAEGCGLSWGGPVVVGIRDLFMTLCPPSDWPLCPIGCGDEGSYRCEGDSQADLSVLSFTAPNQADTGETVGDLLDLIIENQGDGAANQFSVGIYLSNDQVITTEDQLLSESRTTVPSLQAGQTYNVPLSSEISIPLGVPSGTYYIGALLDEFYAVDETNEENNYASNLITIQKINHAPNNPSPPSGPSSTYVNRSASFTASATDPDGDSLTYKFDWGDGNVSSWGSQTQNHSWSSVGGFCVKAQAKDVDGATSGWSGCSYINTRVCGDWDGDGVLEFQDKRNWIQKCLRAKADCGDMNKDGEINILDLRWMSENCWALSSD